MQFWLSFKSMSGQCCEKSLIVQLNSEAGEENRIVYESMYGFVNSKHYQLVSKSEERDNYLVKIYENARCVFVHCNQIFV